MLARRLPKTAAWFLAVLVITRARDVEHAPSNVKDVVEGKSFALTPIVAPKAMGTLVRAGSGLRPDTAAPADDDLSGPFYFPGFSEIFCTRQFRISPTRSSFSDGQAIS